jgi:hypothetical protein
LLSEKTCDRRLRTGFCSENARVQTWDSNGGARSSHVLVSGGYGFVIQARSGPPEITNRFEDVLGDLLVCIGDYMRLRGVCYEFCDRQVRFSQDLEDVTVGISGL